MRTVPFLYVGRISKEKNVDALIDGFDEIVRRGYQASLVFVGDGHTGNIATRCRTGLLPSPAYWKAKSWLGPTPAATACLSLDHRYLRQRGSGSPGVRAARDRLQPGRPRGNRPAARVGDDGRSRAPQALADAMEKIMLDADRRGDLRKRGLNSAAESRWENVLEEFWSRDERDSVEME